MAKDIRRGARALILRAKGKKKNEFKVRYIDARRRILGSSGETFKRRAGCNNNIRTMLKLFGGERVLVIDNSRYYDVYWLYADGHKVEVKD
jgi:hypothetical protein